MGPDRVTRPATWTAVLALLVLASPPLPAQQAELEFRHLTVSDGLSQNTVQAIEQDRRGFLWFGTKDGLNRHDGYGFLVFRHDPADPGSLSDGNVTALLEDARGRLWVGTRHGGLNLFDRTGKTFRRPPGGPSHPVTSLAEGPRGDLWIGTDGAGLYRMDPDTTRTGAPVFTRFVHDPDDSTSLADDRVHAVLVDRRGTLWVGTDGGLSRLDGAGTPGAGRGFVTYRKDPADPGGLIDRRVTALLEDGAERLWVGSVPGVSVMDADRRGFTHHPHRYRTDRYGWGAAVDLLEDRSGRIWVATHSELMRFDPGTAAWTYLRHDPRDPDGINSNSPTVLFRDRSEVLWIGTNGFGINVHDTKAGRFRTFRRPPDRTSRIAGFSVYTLFEDSRRTVWIGAGVLYRWDRDTGALTSFETTSDRPDDFGNTAVWSILEDPPGFLWAGTNQGLYHYEIATGRHRQLVHDPGAPDGLPGQEVYGVHRSRDGSLWVVTARHLARLVDPAAGRFRSYRYLAEAVPGRWTFPSVHEDGDGVLWLGSNRGLVRFDPATEEMRHYRHDPASADGLGHDVVRSLCPDPREPDRYLWIGTAGGGLHRLDKESGRFLRLTADDGLPNDVVYGILPDDTGHLWLSTNRGLARFDPATRQFRSYDADDGLQSDEFNSGAYFRSPGGELYFGGPYGLNYFHPGRIEDNPHVPEIALTAFRRHNRPEAAGDDATARSAAVSEADSLRLGPGDHVIAFEFAALDFSAPAKNRYAYRMVGFNDTWIEAGTTRSAIYTNLPPGSYTFQVKGSNNDGVWNEEGTSLAVVVASPWWATRWAYGAFGLLLLAALVGLRRYEMSRMRLEGRLAIERMEAAKLRDLEGARNRFFADVSHELRTPLTLIAGPLRDLLSGRHGELSSPVERQVELARRNAARVLGLINQILELARLEAGRARLRARPLELGAFVEGVAAAFSAPARRGHVALEVTVPGTPVEVHGDPDQLETILSNLLSNALKFTPERGAVRITVEERPSRIRVTVRDSGPGIPAESLPHVFDRFYRVEDAPAYTGPGTGIGLALARELAELHGGSLRAESEEGVGSTFILELRRGRAHLSPGQLRPPGEATPADGPGKPAPGPRDAAAGRAGGLPAPGAERGGGEAGDAAPDGEDVTTVLVVEDDPDMRAYVRTHLSPIYRVLEAEDGERGLHAARRDLPDLVLSDVTMPGLDGYELCRALKTDPETDFIPVVLLTARAGAGDRLTGLGEQADDYLTKPFDADELRARIGNLIASRRRLRERFSAPGLTLHATPVDVEPADAAFVDRVRLVIEENLGDEEFTVERFAREMAYSRGHLHRKLRELLEETPSGLIRRLRLERAAQLIGAGAGSIATVAYTVGFKSVAHFSNRFVDQFGVRPSAYRAGMRGPDAEGGKDEDEGGPEPRRG